eukprot:jgi/Undpi1/5617/HiC_scaffold_2.g00892.m1
MIASRVLFALSYVVFCYSGALGFRPQTGSIRSAAVRWTGSVSPSGSLSEFRPKRQQQRRQHCAARQQRRRGSSGSDARRGRGAAGGLAMQQSDDDARKTKLRLRVEAESPFRKVRIFIFSSFVISATVGLLVSTTRAIALSQGIDQGQAADELALNIAVDLGAIAASVFLVRRDLAAQDARMTRMEIGAKLAGLKVRMQLKDDQSTVTLSALRRDRGRDKRVAVLVGGPDAVRSSLESALPYGEALENSDILIVPLVLEGSPGGGGASQGLRASGGENDLESAAGMAHVGLPVALNRWQEYIDSEVETAVSQGIDPVKDGFSLVLKKNGRIGARSKGCPPWGTLVGDVERRKASGMDTTNI